MRVITEEAINAFYNKKRFKKNNTEVYVGEFTTMLILFTHTIAYLHHNNNDLEITTAGYNTATTRDRLNGIPGVHVTSRKGQLRLNGSEWDGKLIKIY
jgi:hypothetical protein